MTLKRHLISGAIAAAAALTIGVAPAAANARYPYTLIEPGTFGGPGSFLDEPGVSITSNGTVLGTADTTTPDPDLSPSGFTDGYVQHAFE